MTKWNSEHLSRAYQAVEAEAKNYDAQRDPYVIGALTEALRAIEFADVEVADEA